MKQVVCIDDYPFPKMLNLRKLTDGCEFFFTGSKNPDNIEIFLTLGNIYEILDNGSETSYKLYDDSGKIVILSKTRFVDLEEHRQKKLEEILK